MYDDKEARRKARKRRDPEELAREHPVRVAILAMLDGEGVTAEQVRDELPELPERACQAVAYHLAVLLDAGLVRATDGPPRRFTLAA